MDKLLTKRNVFFFGLLGVILLVSLGTIMSMDMCYQNGACHDFFRSSFIRVLLFLLLPCFPLFIFSLFTYKMREEIFTTWINFAKWWIPLTILFTLFAPGSDGSFLPVTKGSVSFVMSTLFAALSFCIIIAMWAQKEKK